MVAQIFVEQDKTWRAVAGNGVRALEAPRRHAIRLNKDLSDQDNSHLKITLQGETSSR